MTGTDDLQERVALLEQENARLRAEVPTRQRITWRGLLAGLMIAVALLLAPAAVLGAWVRAQLVDTDRFVATFAPLASDPDVRVFLADQVATAISEQIDYEELVGAVFEGLASLDLPPRAAAGLALLEAPAVAGIQSLVSTASERLVASDQFAAIWETTLRVTHQNAVTLLEGSGDTPIVLTDDGVIGIDLSAIADRVTAALAQQGIGFAPHIPAVDRTIPLVQSDALVLVRTLYALAGAVGFWLPWAVLALLAGGILLARNRPGAIARTGVGLVLVLGLLAAGLGVARLLFVHALSPRIMPAASAHAVFAQLTDAMRSTIAALILLAVIAAVGAWLAGEGRRPRLVRTTTAESFERLRRAADARGMSPGVLGGRLDRLRPAIFGIAVLGAVVALMSLRPLSLAGVCLVVAVLLIVLILVELLRRPTPEHETSDTRTSA